jgi:hypothetical protein
MFMSVQNTINVVKVIYLALLHIYREVNVGRVKILDKFDTGNKRIGALRL